MAGNDGNIINNLKTFIVSIYDYVVGIASSIMTLTETGGTLTTDGTEQNMYINNAPAGLYSPRDFFIDFTNQTAGETLVIREYYRIKSGGALIINVSAEFAAVQDPLMVQFPLKDTRYGIKVTAELTAGVNRAYDWGVTYAI